MCTLGKHLHILLIRLVNLRALQNLQRYGAVLIIGKEWATTRFTDILHDATDAHRTIQLAAKIVSILLLSLRIGAEVFANKLGHFCQLLISSAFIQNTQILKGFLLQGYQHTSDNLLPDDGICLQTIRNNVVDILDEDDISLYLVEVLDEGTMATRTEQQRTITIAERSAIGIGSDSIGRRLLLREGNIILNTIFISIEVGLLSHLLLEQFHVLVADGEVYVSLTIRGSIQCSLYQVLLHRGAWTFRIVMEQEQTLGQLTVVQSLGCQHIGRNGLVVTLRLQRLDTLTIILLTDSIKLAIEGKLHNIIEILLFKICGRFVIVGIDKGKHIFEHAAGSTRSRHKLHHLLALSLILLPSIYKTLALSIAGSYDTTTDGGSSL